MTSAGSSPAAAQFPSAASYAHFLYSRLLHQQGAHRRALDELRLGLATDDGNPFLMTVMAEEYARLSELERATAQLQKVIEQSPDYAPAQLLLGRVLLEANHGARAKVHLQRAIRLRPRDLEAYLVLTQLMLDEGRVEDAVRVVEELGRALPGDPVGFRRLGLALAERGDLLRAERLLRRAVERDPGDQESWMTLARAAEAGGRGSEALVAYGRALQRDPDNGEVLLAAGRLSLKMGDEVAAKAHFERLISLSRDPERVVKVAFSWLAVNRPAQAAEVLESGRRDTDEPRLHFYTGLVRERLRDFSRAAEAYAQVPEQLAGLYDEARLHRAVCVSSLGEHTKALELFRGLHEERPDLPGLDVAWARASERAGQHKEAEVLLVRALAQDPSSDSYEAFIGFAARHGRTDEAVAFIKALWVRQPDSDTLRFALASALERQGAWREAIELVRGVLVGNPRHAAAMNFLGYTLANRGDDLEEAERWVRKALESAPGSAAYLDSMGWVLFKKNEPERAADFLERAVRENGDEPTLLEHLGEVQARLNRRDKAIESWSRALELLEVNPDAAERTTQRAELERKLKSLTNRSAGR
jgi:tetratricopeptide (TPR) repeat protein